ncbi:MAG: glycoside hydrolase family 3 C-terminal domain-containing protein [Lachnospiraceae bacterium]|nr:glycoside hydrolase family 3 C-terminal domain-containing protein [Lachnospiraceae bacterium]
MTKEKIEKLIAKLTLQEKIGMIHGDGFFTTKGVERLGIPPFKTSDGPRGVRKDFENAVWKDIGLSYDYVSYLPCNTALAATWNRALAYSAGRLLGKEARGRGKDMILAPGINIMRTPMCGRSFEYMGEDPYLVSEMVVPVVQGIEENDVSSCVKHFAVNNQETRRLDVDVEVSERALREIYLPGFEAAVKKGKAKGVMGAYNKLRGTHCCHHDYLLNDILRKEWGFEGITVSDWGGVHDTKEALLNGLDMEMSVTDNFDEYYMAEPIIRMIEGGEVDKKTIYAKIDEKVRHILNVMNKLHMLDGERSAGGYNDYEDKAVLRQTARESVVLLKNNKEILPLDRKKIKKLLVVGENANRQHAPGGGSAEIKALYEITPLMGLNMLLGGNTEIIYKPGYCNEDIGNIWANTGDSENGQADSLNQDNNTTQVSQEPGTKTESEEKKQRQKEMNEKYLKEALEAAQDADAVIYVGGLTHDYDTEGQDRVDMKLPYEQDRLISELLHVRPDAVITLVAGSPVDMSAWLDNADTLVYSWYAGMEGGIALAEVLFGDVNPSGHLPETFPVSEKDCPVAVLGEFPGGDKVNYGEDIFVGYRYYDTYDVATAFPFGYGLSYTDFVMTGIRAEVLEDTADSKSVKVSFDVSNIGSRAGAAVAQIYVADKCPKVRKAAKELKAFEKIFLEAGEAREISLILERDAFMYFDEGAHSFKADAGSYMLLLAKNADEVVDITEIEFKAS